MRKRTDRLSDDRAHSIRAAATRDYILGSVNEHRYLGSSQDSRVYRAQVDRIDLSLEKAELKFRSASVGGKMTVASPAALVLNEGGSE